jgi:hypothetical protein
MTKAVKSPKIVRSHYQHLEIKTLCHLEKHHMLLVDTDSSVFTVSLIRTTIKGGTVFLTGVPIIFSREPANLQTQGLGVGTERPVLETTAQQAGLPAERQHMSLPTLLALILIPRIVMIILCWAATSRICERQH